MDRRRLDEIAANATAPSRVERIGGWQLRADPTLPFRRSNSTVPLGDPESDGEFDVEVRIDAVEAYYRDRSMPPRVQMLPASTPPDLDDRLARRGYAVEAPVDILTAGLDDVRETTSTASPSLPTAVRVRDVVDLDWAAAFADTATSLDRVQGYRRLISATGRSGFVATVDLDGAPAAIGFSVVECEWVGVFGMATHPAHRRHGAARAVLGVLADHASALGATNAYLQVEVDNVAARRLYESAGFTYSHSHHYRVAR
jgi:ribosomal protein S18 acetylase RimI-like enzyme